LPDGGVQWLVASSEALDLLHWALPTVTYRRIAMAIKMTSKVDVFFSLLLFAMHPGGRLGNTERLVAPWRIQRLRIVPGHAASGIACGITPMPPHGHKDLVIHTT